MDEKVHPGVSGNLRLDLHITSEHFRVLAIPPFLLFFPDFTRVATRRCSQTVLNRDGPKHGLGPSSRCAVQPLDELYDSFGRDGRFKYGIGVLCELGHALEQVRSGQDGLGILGTDQVKRGLVQVTQGYMDRLGSAQREG